MAISSNGNYIAAGDCNYVYLFSKCGDLLWKYDVGRYVGSVAISSNGSYIAAASENSVYFFKESTKALGFEVVTCLAVGILLVLLKCKLR